MEPLRIIGGLTICLSSIWMLLAAPSEPIKYIVASINFGLGVGIILIEIHMKNRQFKEDKERPVVDYTGIPYKEHKVEIIKLTPLKKISHIGTRGRSVLK